MIEYDPQPPYDSGSLAKADAKARRHAAELMMSGLRENTPAGTMAHFEVIP